MRTYIHEYIYILQMYIYTYARTYINTCIHTHTGLNFLRGIPLSSISFNVFDSSYFWVRSFSNIYESRERKKTKCRRIDKESRVNCLVKFYIMNGNTIHVN
jgi:hypothetical protein